MSPQDRLQFALRGAGLYPVIVRWKQLLVCILQQLYINVLIIWQERECFRLTGPLFLSF